HYAAYRETLEKRATGFRMSDWDGKLLKYGARFESEMMDLAVNIPLEESLDRGWRLLADCFEAFEVGIASRITDEFWKKARD
ncbi:MAG: V-type ATP synthase subunit B, partial [Kiritimatiellae bacterium]|nr:V-type ATP synthase subunit B [Kiritimatiellia bacterium]